MKRLLGSCPSFPLSCQDLEFPASRVQVPHAGSQTHPAVTSCLFWGLLWGLQVWRPLCPCNQLSTLTLPSLSLGSLEAWVRHPTWITLPIAPGQRAGESLWALCGSQGSAVPEVAEAGLGPAVHTGPPGSHPGPRLFCEKSLAPYPPPGLRGWGSHTVTSGPAWSLVVPGKPSTCVRSSCYFLPRRGSWGHCPCSVTWGALPGARTVVLS